MAYNFKDYIFSLTKVQDKDDKTHIHRRNPELLPEHKPGLVAEVSLGSPGAADQFEGSLGARSRLYTELIVEGIARQEEGLQVVETVITPAQHAQAELDLYIRIDCHTLL